MGHEELPARAVERLHGWKYHWRNLDRTNVVIVWTNVHLHDSFWAADKCASGGFKGALVNGVTMLICFIGRRLNQLMFRIIAPLFIASRFTTIICDHCYRVTFPLKCRYELGQRFCEHCQQAVEDTKVFGKVIFTFGDVPFFPEGRVFVFSNPDFEYKEYYIEVSEVYLDPQTTDKRLFERFITYIVNYPPRRGLNSVTIFYRGELEDLGVPLANALRNTCEQVIQMG